MNNKNKIHFIYAMAKHSILHPECGIEFVKWYSDVKKDRNRPIHTFSNSNTSIKDVLKQLFPDIEIPKHDLSKLDFHCNEFLKKKELEKYPSKNAPYPTLYSIDNDSGYLLYVICKIMKPGKVVETGVAYGRSSSYILQALHENGHGKLYSIDYSFRHWESKQMIGSMIPNHLRDNWNLIYGIASKKLKPLLKSLGQIDIFIHDSAHTYNNMMSEYNISWPFIKKDGLLMSDDITNAFYDFYTQKNTKPILFSQKIKDKNFFGIIKK